MKRLRIVLLEDGDIVCVPKASDLPKLAGQEPVKGNFYENMPQAMVKMIKSDHEIAEELPGYIQYLVKCNLCDQKESDTAFGYLKRKIAGYAQGIVSIIRSLTKKLARQIINFQKHQIVVQRKFVQSRKKGRKILRPQPQMRLVVNY